MATAGYWLLGNLAIVHVSGEETEGRFCLVEFQTPADDWIPLHVHRRDSQTVYVLEGEVTFYLPGEQRALGAGECIHQPAGVPQTEHVTSSGPARMLDVNSPAGFERFIEAAGEPAASLTLPPPPAGPPDFEAFSRLAADHGVDILGPPGALPEG
jgi:mannose-6-phosphate isomerase-like protein (cupin superfamily)